MVRGTVSSQPLCCSCNGARARCIRCLCSRRGTPCSNCTAGKCQNKGANITTIRNEASGSTSQAEHSGLTERSFQVSDEASELHRLDQSTEVLPIVGHPLPSFDPARDDYIWGDRPAREVTPLIEAAYREAMHWRPNLFVPPTGNTANDLVIEMTKLVTHFVEKSGFERVALTAFFLLPCLILQLPASRRVAAKRKAMARRLEMWRAGSIEDLLKEGRAIQERLQINKGVTTGWKKGFVRLMLSGRSSAAMRLLRNGSSKGVLSLEESLKGESVRDILYKKHPAPTAANSECLESTPLPRSRHGHPVLFESVDGKAISKSAMATQGGAGPSGLDANAWRQLLTGYRHSQQLAEAIAGFARRVSTETVDPASMFAYTSSRLVPLDKNPGVRPVGIGEVVRRIVGKAILRVISADLRRVAGSDQLCVGQRAGIESAIHELRSSFSASNRQCLIQIDADNAFNTLNRSLLLHNIENICPLLKTVLLNTYRKDSFLTAGKELFYSREGLTQGDNLAMAAFGANTLPLIQHLKEQLPNTILQKWYADDANATGELLGVRKFLDLLTSIGPSYGYRVNTQKCWLIVHPGRLDEARRMFEDIPINITEDGHQILGSAIGTEDYVRSFSSKKCDEYIQQLEHLADISKEEPHLAYSALVHCLQAQWQHLLRTTPQAPVSSLHRVEETIITKLLPVLLKRSSISEVEREWLALPVRDGGMSIATLSVEQSSDEYVASQQMCRPLSEEIEWEECELRQNIIARHLRCNRLQKRQQQSASLHAKLNTFQQRAREVAGEKGAASWLHTRPLEAQGYHLSPNEFHDAVALRMGWPPNDLPKKCRCGAVFEVSHALSCQLGGFPTHRHNETRDLLADIMTEVGNSVAIEPTLTPVDGRTFERASTTTDPNARVDIVAGGVWGGRFDRAYFDVCVFNAFAQSNAAKPLTACYAFHEQRKIAKYAERVREVEHSSFIPLVFSSSGGCGPITDNCIRRLAHLLAKKRKIEYKDAINWLRRRLVFSLIRASSQALRGARSKLHTPQHPADTSIQATNGMTLPHSARL